MHTHTHTHFRQSLHFRNALAVLSANLLLVASAKIRVPLGVVDFTLQSFLVPMLVCVMGRKLALITVGSYLLEGALGFSVFQGTPERGIGIMYMAGPTAGYLFGFFIAQLIPTLKSPSNNGSVYFRLGLGHLVIHGLGIFWLSVLFGFERALAIDGQFWLGMLTKIILGGSILKFFSSPQDC